MHPVGPFARPGRILAALAPALLVLVALPPVAPAEPPLCADPCIIASNFSGYDPAIAFVASGTAVVWTSSDTNHANADGVLPDGSDSCFLVNYSPFGASTPVWFNVTPEGLQATSFLFDGTKRVDLCESAVAAPGGGFALPYWCVLHPNMRALLVVTA